MLWIFKRGREHQVLLIVLNLIAESRKFFLKITHGKYFTTVGYMFSDRAIKLCCSGLKIAIDNMLMDGRAVFQ